MYENKGVWFGDSFRPDPSVSASFEGFRWRSDNAVKANYVWLSHYVTEDKPNNVSKVWYDQLVVATEYIGPMKPGRKE